MFMLSFFAYLRVSEVARMVRGDLSFSASADGSCTMAVHVNRMSKNDSERLGHERLVAGRAVGQYCVVRALQQHLSVDSSAAASSPLFCTRAGKAMRVDTPRGRFRHWLQVIGVDASLYGFHSLRAGGATAAAQAGVEERHIKAQGNWKSDAFKSYIRPDQQDRLRVSRAIGSKL